MVHNHNHHHLHFELVSPEKVIYSKSVAMVTVPGGEGDYGVLVGHAPMITTVKAGVIEVFLDENAPATERLFITGGFAEVTQKHCIVLADEAIPVSSLDRTSLDEEAKILADKIRTLPENERAGLLAQQAIVMAKIKAMA